MGYITIDVGTTNTRIRYIENEKILAEYKNKVGVRDTAITGSLDKLKCSIKQGIIDCLKKSARQQAEVEKIIASGMITSNLGLLEIPHLQTPVGEKKLASHVVIKCFEDIVQAPIYFVPGVRNRVENISIDNFDQVDMMRGEEVEALGAIHLTQTVGAVLFISPGSHTKFVFINEDKEIIKCSTTLTGEILWALTKETILASSIPKDLITTVEQDYIEQGIRIAQKHGFSKTCFLTRIMDTFVQTTGNQRANFIMGAIGYYDIKSIEEDLWNKRPHVLIGGSRVLRTVYNCILESMNYDMHKVALLEDHVVEKANAIGAIKVVEQMDQ